MKINNQEDVTFLVISSHIPILSLAEILEKCNLLEYVIHVQSTTLYQEIKLLIVLTAFENKTAFLYICWKLL